MDESTVKIPWYQSLSWKLTLGYSLVALIALFVSGLLFALGWAFFQYMAGRDVDPLVLALETLSTAMWDNLVLVPVVVVFAHLLSRHFHERVAALVVAADAWGRGDFTVRPKDKSRDEIGVLSRHLLRMVEQLQFLIRERQELSAVRERNRLARDLHDTVKQQVFATQMELNAARNLLATDPQAAGEALDEAIDMVRRSQQDLKALIAHLRPAGLEDGTLGTVLSQYVPVHAPKDVKVHLEITNDRNLPLDIEEAVFRVAQAALANVSIHAQANNVTVQLSMIPDAVSLRVADDGIGFDIDKVEPNAFGLIVMRERMEEIGGTLRIESSLGAGTTVWATVPLGEVGQAQLPQENRE